MPFVTTLTRFFSSSEKTLMTSFLSMGSPPITVTLAIFIFL